MMALPTALVGLAIALMIPEERRQLPFATPQDSGRKGGQQKHRRTRQHPGSHWLRDPVILLIAAANFCSLYGFFLLLTWLPYYLQTVRGILEVQTGWLASLAWWVSIPSSLLFSSLSDRFVPRRAVMMGLMAVAGIALALIPHTTTEAQLVAALVLYGVTGKLTLDPIIVAFVAEWVPRGNSAGAFGFLNFSGMLGSVLAPLVTGLILDANGWFAGAFLIGALLLGVGVLCVVGTFRYHGATITPGLADIQVHNRTAE